MNTNRTETSTNNHRSYFDWGCNMQVVRKGNGKIAMTESELARFFGVTRRKLNHRLQMLMKYSFLHSEEKVAGEEEVIINGQLKGYAPLYSLTMIIALSFLLDSVEAYLFRKYVCREMQRPAATITPILLFGNTNN